MSWRARQGEGHHRSPEVGVWGDRKFYLPLQIGSVWGGHRKIASEYLCDPVTPKPAPLFLFSLDISSYVRREEVILWRMGSREN